MSRYRSEVEELLANFAGTLDDRDFERALRFERENPRKHVAQIERYRSYIRSHAQGGRHVKEATQAIERIDQERDRSTYAFAYDHWIQHPMDLEEVARRMRSYRETVPEGRFRADADRFLSWFEKVEKGADYRVTLVRGNVSPMVGKYLSGGGPNLAVTVWVGGRKYGPTPAIPDTRSPIWGFTFGEPIRWRMGEPVRIQLSDSDWSDSVVLDLTTPPDDKLAIRTLSGTVRPTKHPDLATLEFASTFRMPTLRPPG